jgi:hypothetical protein
MTAPMLAAIFTPDQPPERLGAVASAADAAGLAQLWIWEDCFKESGIATATAILATTSQVTVGIGLLPVPLRNVALTAMEIATLARLFPGRLSGTGGGTAGGMVGGCEDVVVFVSVPAESPAADVAAAVSEYARAGATHVAVNTDADLERFVTFLAGEVSPLVG